MSRRIAFITREDVKAKWGTLSQSKKALATDTGEPHVILFFFMDAAFTLALRLRSISTQINGWKPDTHGLPLESRVAQVEHAIGEAIMPHVSLQRLLNQSMYTIYTSNPVKTTVFRNYSRSCQRMILTLIHS